MLILVMVAVVLGVPAMASADILVGVLVDSACNAKLGAAESIAADHTKCAIACAQKGHRLALITPTGIVMVTGALTLNNNAQLIPLMNRPVVMTGTVGTLDLQSAVPVPSSPTGDGRRPTGSQAGVVTNPVVRTGDFRQGDVPGSVVMAIQAISVQPLVLGVPIP
jgi:hypothetical protein